jgi:nucleotide-binding universal stress UspA family protein
MKRIVIGTEGSADAMRAVEDGLEVATGLQASVTFVCARPAPNALLGEPFYQRELDAEIAHAREVIAEAMQQAAAAGVDADYEIIEGQPADAILHVAETHDADLIVVGSRGLGTMQSAIFGSVSKALVTRSKRPVLVVKGSGDEPQRDVPLVNDGAVLGR